MPLKIGDTIRIRKAMKLEVTEGSINEAWNRAAALASGGYHPRPVEMELFTIQNEEDLKRAQELMA